MFGVGMRTCIRMGLRALWGAYVFNAALHLLALGSLLNNLKDLGGELVVGQWLRDSANLR